MASACLKFSLNLDNSWQATKKCFDPETCGSLQRSDLGDLRQWHCWSLLSLPTSGLWLLAPRWLCALKFSPGCLKIYLIWQFTQNCYNLPNAPFWSDLGPRLIVVIWLPRALFPTRPSKFFHWTKNHKSYKDIPPRFLIPRSTYLLKITASWAGMARGRRSDLPRAAETDLLPLTSPSHFQLSWLLISCDSIQCLRARTDLTPSNTGVTTAQWEHKPTYATTFPQGFERNLKGFRGISHKKIDIFQAFWD